MRFIVFLVVYILILSPLQGQDRLLDRANAAFENYRFQEAIYSYERIIEKNKASAEVYAKLASAYYNNANYSKAVHNFNLAHALDKAHLNNTLVVQYANSMQATGHEKQAIKLFKEYSTRHKTSNEMALISAAYAYLKAPNKWVQYEVIPFSFNSPASDYGGYYYGDELYFTSNSLEQKTKKKDPWTHAPTHDIFRVNLEDKVRTRESFNSAMHESSFIITKDGKTAYITQSSKIKNSKGLTVLHIYRLHKNAAGEWGKKEGLSINSNTYSCAHPSLSVNEDQLYFASDRPGGYGLTDIYKVPIHGDGTLGKVLNLGPIVNTKGRESFPYISETDELYFSSDGHFGMGGYDVYYYANDGSQNPMLLLNLGQPINGKSDDFAFGLHPELGFGTLSSDRSGNDDIYKVKELISPKKLLKHRIIGQVLDAKTKVPLKNFPIQITDAENQIISEVITDGLGYYIAFSKTPLEQYHMYGLDDSYEKEAWAFTKQAPFEAKLNITSFQKAQKSKTEQLAQALHDFNTKVYFDTNSSYLNVKAQKELNVLAKLLQKEPHQRLYLETHADKRGTKNYNHWLTQRRALRIKDYLLSKGVLEEQVTAVPMGETKADYHCEDRQCHEEIMHAKNRKATFSLFED